MRPFQLLIHTFKVMALCADESIFATYYPAESKSFCGRVLQEQLEDGFVNVHGSPRRSYLDRTPQAKKPTGVGPRGDVPSSASWRAAEPPPAPPHGFAPVPAAAPANPLDPAEGSKPRRRRRRRTPFTALAATLEASEGAERPDLSDRDEPDDED